jgi:hypothetical protein
MLCQAQKKRLFEILTVYFVGLQAGTQPFLSQFHLLSVLKKIKQG